MKKIKVLMGCLVVTMILGLNSEVFSQRKQGGGVDPAQMAEKEKQEVLTKVTTLNDDQKLALDQIYKDYATGIKNLMKNGTGDKEQMRAKRQELAKTKDEAVKVQFTDEQYTLYEEVMASRREKMQAKRRQ